MLPVAGTFGAAGLLAAFLAPTVKGRAVVERGVEILGHRVAVAAEQMNLGEVVQGHGHPHAVGHPAGV